jgi:hypothetical protein
MKNLSHVASLGHGHGHGREPVKSLSNKISLDSSPLFSLAQSGGLSVRFRRKLGGWRTARSAYLIVADTQALHLTLERGAADAQQSSSLMTRIASSSRLHRHGSPVLRAAIFLRGNHHHRRAG